MAKQMSPKNQGRTVGVDIDNMEGLNAPQAEQLVELFKGYSHAVPSSLHYIT